MTKIQHGAILECKWEVFKKVILSCTNKCFSTNRTSWKFRKKLFDKECGEAKKCLMVLDVVKDKENYQKHLHNTKALFKEREEYGKSLNNFSKRKRKDMHVLNFGEI